MLKEKTPRKRQRASIKLPVVLGGIEKETTATSSEGNFTEIGHKREYFGGEKKLGISVRAAAP